MIIKIPQDLKQSPKQNYSTYVLIYSIILQLVWFYVCLQNATRFETIP